jgi:hypothetical protein
MKHAFTTTRGGIGMEIGGSKYVNGSARRRPEPQPPPPGFYQLADRTGGLTRHDERSRQRRVEPTPYSLLFADSGGTRTTATAYAVGETRPRPSTIYPQQREPEGEPYGSRFVLKIPEITLTPDLKNALLQSMRSDARVEDTEFRIGDNNTVEIEALGDRAFASDLIPVSQRLFGMLQAGLEPDEMAELLVLFEGKYDINTDRKGGVALSLGDREITSADLCKCVDKLLQLGCPDLAKDGLRHLYYACLFQVSGLTDGKPWPGDPGDGAKRLAGSQISNQPWAAWARAALDKLG